MKIGFLKIFVWMAVALFSTTVFAEAPQSTKEIIKDSVITGAIKAKIVMDQSISVFHIDVSTKDGVVNLSGTVNSDTQARALYGIAKSTEGVKRVDVTHLNVVQSTQYLTDAMITAKVKGLLLQEKLFGKKNVPVDDLNVETNNGVVYLSGKANSQEQAENVIILVKTVEGVRRVESRIRVIK